MKNETIIAALETIKAIAIEATYAESQARRVRHEIANMAAEALKIARMPDHHAAPANTRYVLDQRDLLAIEAIAARCCLLADQHGLVSSVLQRSIELVIVHNNVTHLDLDSLFGAADLPFIEELTNISENLDADNMRFRNGFTPRFAAKGRPDGVRLNG